MGVSGLNKLITTYGNNSISYKQFKDYRGTVQGLDASLTLYKFCLATVKTNNFKNNNGKIIGHLFACMSKTRSMLNYGIMPVWIFDGKPPNIKKDILSKRRKDREDAYQKLKMNIVKENVVDNSSLTINNRLEKKTFTISKVLISEVKQLLDLMGIPYIDSPEEADAQCSAFNIANVCYGVVSDDWDVLLFGCKKMLKNFSNKNMVIEIDSKQLIESLGMTSKDQLIDLCLLYGTDYCPGIKGLNKIQLYDLFKMLEFNVESLVEYLKINYLSVKIPSNFLEKYYKAKEYYIHAPVIDPEKIKKNIVWKEPQYNRLHKYLVINNGFPINKINEFIIDLKTMYKFYEEKCRLSTISYLRKS